MAGHFVVDTSVVMAWCFEDESDVYSDRVLESFIDSEAVVPGIWPLEVGNVLLVAERKKRITRTSAVRFIELLGGLPITVEQETTGRIPGEVLALAREQGLSTYDASYLDLAMKEGLPISTRDASLRKAARRCAVPLYDL